ncbi:hypothetical protein TUM20985_29120 [Mycobacterium antarcticum]|nr:hypothetical protein TUM20985_29120 [Mycolicibacterium sp. TUM20985]GLP84092.1 hypothetical protein TUM20984_55120 [Mycolicibacterium sp. TUM20984]
MRIAGRSDVFRRVIPRKRHTVRNGETALQTGPISTETATSPTQSSTQNTSGKALSLPSGPNKAAILPRPRTGEPSAQRPSARDTVSAEASAPIA